MIQVAALPKTTVVNLRFEEYDVRIDRSGPWGNPFVIGEDGTREEVIAKYRRHILNYPDLLKRLYELRGKRLGCFCKPKACHGDILVDLIGQRGTIDEWAKEYDIKVLDPDGFDRKDPRLMERLFTRDEFLAGAQLSTIEGSEESFDNVMGILSTRGKSNARDRSDDQDKRPRCDVRDGRTHEGQGAGERGGDGSGGQAGVPKTETQC